MSLIDLGIIDVPDLIDMPYCISVCWSSLVGGAHRVILKKNEF